MKTIVPQFPLPLPQLAGPSAPLTLEPQPATQAPTADLQLDLLTCPPPPPAKDLAAWIARQPARARARLRHQCPDLAGIDQSAQASQPWCLMP